jgi:polysaccharide biosynthesis/export protein
MVQGEPGHAATAHQVRPGPDGRQQEGWDDMKTRSKLTPGLGLLLACLVIAGCVSAPGMQMDTSTAALIRARADLFTIDADTLRQLAQERRAQAASQATARSGFGVGSVGSSYEYQVAPQDVLRVTVWNHPELTNPSGTRDELVGRVVNADGRFFFPYAGSVQAAGRTVDQIRDDLVTGLKRIIKTPQVDVSVMQYRGQRVHIAGEVRTPGVQAINDVPPDLTEMLARAGGFTPEADLAGVTVTRGPRTLRVDVQSLYYQGDMRSNVRLQPGDVVNVPERRDNRVFVTGEVIRPAPLWMPRGRMSLAEALAEAGGVNPLSASAGQVFVIRGGSTAGNGAGNGTPSAGGTATSAGTSTSTSTSTGASTGAAHGEGEGERARIYHLDAASPNAFLLADRFDLAARDVVYVDTAPIVRWNRVISNVLPSALVGRDMLNDTTRAFPR